MTTDNFCLYLQNRLNQTSQTGGQWYNDTSPFSIPCLDLLTHLPEHQWRQKKVGETVDVSLDDLREETSRHSQLATAQENLKHLVPYSQHSILFVTYESAQ